MVRGLVNMVRGLVNMVIGRLVPGLMSTGAGSFHICPGACHAFHAVMQMP